MKRLLLLGLLPASGLTALWLVARPASPEKGVSAEWLEPTWNTKERFGTDSTVYEFRTVRIWNEATRDLTNVYMTSGTPPDERAVETIAGNMARHGELRAGRETYAYYRRPRGEKMTLSVLVFDCTKSELVRRVEQRARFPWAKSLLPLRYRIVTLPDDSSSPPSS